MQRVVHTQPPPRQRGPHDSEHFSGLPHVFNCATLARYLDVDLKTIQALAQQGKIPCRKVGKAYRFFAPAVVKWLLGPHATLLDAP